MRTSKKIVSLVLAVMMVMTMMSVMAVSTAFAAGERFEVVTLGDAPTGSVGDQFSDINDAINAAGDNGAIKLIVDTEFDGNSDYILITTGKSTTLDLNGHKIISNGTMGINMTSNLPGVMTLTIKDTSSPKKGEIITTVNPNYPGCACITSDTGRKVVIESGKFTSDAKALYIQGAGADIKGGTFNGDVLAKSTFTVSGSPTINGDVTVEGSGFYFDSGWTSHSDPATATISGGTFNGEITAGSTENTIVVTGGTFTDDVSQYVDTTTAKVEFTAANGKVSYPKSLNSLSEGTYKLLGDFTQSARMVPGLFASNVVFDLNGFTLTSTAADEAFLFSRAGTAANHKSYTIKNGTVIAAGDGVQLLADYADLTLDNVDIVANGTYGVVTNGTKKGNNITATDSSITAGTVGIYKPSNGSLTLTDTDVTGKTAVYVKSGDVTIDGGTFTGTGAAADYAYNGNGVNLTGDAVVIDNCGYPGGAPTVAILDGNFSSTNGDAVASYVKQDDPQQTGSFEQVEGFIYGGTYDGDVDNSYVAPGLEDVPAAGGKFVIEIADDFEIGEIDGYQLKIARSSESTSAEGNDIYTSGVRVITNVDKNFLETQASEYGYVVAKYTGDKALADLDFSMLTADGGNGQKVINCKGTHNNGITNVTDNGQVTLAVNGMADGDKVVVRFFAVIDGVTYYSNYATYDGILATYTAN